MNFLSIEFIAFFALFLALLLVVRGAMGRKILLLAASCVFYAWWDWRFLGLLVFTILATYFLAHWLAASTSETLRRVLLWSGIVLSLAVLGYFKYANFYIDNLNLALLPLGWKLSALNILLPLGISFYTFENIGYLLDVYNEKTPPAASMLDYAVYMTFFPRRISGPITRAGQFFPQMARGVQLNMPNLVQGGQLFLQGAIKKWVVADTLALMVDKVYSSPDIFSSATVWLAVLSYAVQLYCDFSGYTDMARGVSRVFGFDLPINFNLPFTAQSVTEFWRRWHITLSNWFRDYLFAPLEFNRRKVKHLRVESNLVLVFLLTGLWHGANWNFILWGALHGVCIALEQRIFKGRLTADRWNTNRAWARAAVTFFLVTLTFVFFRAQSFSIAAVVFGKLAFFTPVGVTWFYQPAVLLVPAVILGGWTYCALKGKLPKIVLSPIARLTLIALEVVLIFLFAALNTSPFIYFQF